MEDLLEFMFGASGRINRAKYWRSLLILVRTGPFTAIILFAAARLAAPLFIIMVAVVFIPWLMWGFAIHSERLHDRTRARGGYCCSTGCRPCWVILRRRLGLPQP